MYLKSCFPQYIFPDFLYQIIFFHHVNPYCVNHHCELRHNGWDGQGETPRGQPRKRWSSAPVPSLWAAIFFSPSILCHLYETSRQRSTFTFAGHVLLSEQATKSKTQQQREGLTSSSYLVNRGTCSLSGTISVHRMESCDFPNHRLEGRFLSVEKASTKFQG